MRDFSVPLQQRHRVLRFHGTRLRLGGDSATRSRRGDRRAWDRGVETHEKSEHHTGSEQPQSTHVHDTTPLARYFVAPRHSVGHEHVAEEGFPAYTLKVNTEDPRKVDLDSI
ncbi:hypothetical protein [Streptomyces sp. MUSC 14]|uniref:hypothetical protein n=1 Tax=Streptomyces sp. MUSC 14 TaxID=1354889 RepID=UPI0015A6B4DA|nr:hypothetical protein [Streptomyces sp. MUSC 14]